jgi:hypothetical protein
MKTLKQVPVELVELKEGEYMPNEMELGKLYYSKEFGGLGHLCLCGCGQKTYITIGDGEWTVFPNNGKVTITPSLHHRFDCKSHYIITNGVANLV